MKAALLGMGWATPLGRDLETVWQAVQAGREVEHGTLENPATTRVFPVHRVPEEALRDVAGFSRLRRSSVISHLAVAAASDAVAHAGLDADQLSRTALIFATSDGGVAYTRRFYADVMERGEGAGSPLLFPETVYNAPASHIAAKLGLTCESLTLVGDAPVGFVAVRTGCELLATGDVDYCVVVASQEVDWITCEAYERWGLIRSVSAPGAGSVFSEGAAALVLGNQGSTQVQAPHPGTSFKTNADAARELSVIAEKLTADRLPDLVISSISGTRLDAVEKSVIARQCPNATVLTPKKTLGEALACSAIQQIIVGKLALRDAGKSSRALIPAVGFNGQVAALILTEGDPEA